MINFKMFTDKNLLEFNDFKLTYYAVCIFVGIIVATIMAIREGKRFGVTKGMILDGLLICVPLALIGARIYYVLFTLDSYDNFAQMIGFNEEGFGIAGLSIIGAIIVAIVFVIFYSRHIKANMYALLDFLAPGFLIGQIFGRWGNFFNREAHGGIIENMGLMRWLVPGFILDRMEDEYVKGVFYHPTFYYEALWNLIGLIAILIARRKSKKVRVGDFIGFYLIWYGLGRGLLIEPFRTDALMWGAVRINVVIPLLFSVAGVIYLFLKHKNVLVQPYYQDLIAETSAHQNKEFLFDLDCFVASKEIVDGAKAITLEAYPGEHDIAKWNDEVRTYYISCLENGEYSPDGKRLIKKLVKDKCVVGIKTDLDIDTAKHILTRLGISDYIYIIIAGEEEKQIAEYGKYFSKGNLLVISKDVEKLTLAQEAGFKTVVLNPADKNSGEFVASHAAYKPYHIYELAYQSKKE